MRVATETRNAGLLARGLSAVATLLLSGGCATAIRGTTQDVTVITDPPGATCTLASARRNEPVVRVDATPATAKVRRDSWSLAVRCEAPGYVDVQDDIDPAGQGDTSDEHRRLVEASVLGAGATTVVAGVAIGSAALAIGGSASAIGVAAVAWPVMLGVVAAAPIVIAVDALSGAPYGYPPVIVLRLTPAIYPDEAAHAAWFAANDSRLDAADDALRKDTEANCWANCYARRNRDEAFIAARRARYASDRTKSVVTAGSRPADRATAAPP